MVIHGKFAIFRCTEAGDNEDNVIDKIEFEGTASLPDNQSKLVSFNTLMSRTETQNAVPFQEIARKPDTGFSGTRYTIRAFFDESLDEARGIETLVNWYSEPNAIAQLYRNGRFGIRNDYRPEMDLTPNNDAGYKLVHLDIAQDLKVSRVVLATIILEFSGDPGRLRVNI